jgi:hypothetical protein
MEPHKITESEFLKLNQNNVLAVHAWAIRDLLEEQVRLFIFGKREKPTKESLISDFKRFYSESLDQNK